MFIYETKYVLILIKNTLAIIGVIAVAMFSCASLVLTGFQQAANANPPSNANTVQQISKNGAASNQRFMQACKLDYTAQTCATGPTGNGPFTSNLAHDTNKP